MVVEERRDTGFIVRDGLDIHEGSSQLENMHRFACFGNGAEGEGRIRRMWDGRLHFSIALHPHNSKRMTVDRPWTYPPIAPMAPNGAISAE